MLHLVLCALLPSGSAASVSASASAAGYYGSSSSWARALNVTSHLTIAEKLNITNGVGFLVIGNARCSGNTGSVARFGIPGLCLEDGPVGVRPTDGASVFSAQQNLGSTWDVELIYQQALAMGAEFRAKGVNVALAPLTGGPLGRSPYNGRNWEGYGADPYLHGMAGYWGVKGIQDNGVIATAKHYIAYEQETYRYSQTIQSIAGVYPNPAANTVPISSDLSDRTYRELYLWAWEETLRAKPKAIMCSYNRVNGSQACANDRTLRQVLKEELGFGGFVVSDWFSVTLSNSTVQTANAGLDMIMPGGAVEPDFWGAALQAAITNGSVPMSRLDDMCHRILAAYFEAGQDDGAFPATNFNSMALDTYIDGFPGVQNEHINVQADHSKLIKKVGTDSAVLLKNTGANSTVGLPLAQGTYSSRHRLAVFGTDSSVRPEGLNFFGTQQYPATSTNNGTLAVGFGSGSAQFPYLIDPLSAINNAAMEQNWDVTYMPIDYTNDTTLTATRQHYAAQAQTCLVFVAATSGEGLDRASLRLDNNGDALIQDIASLCPDTIVIAHLAGPTNLEIPALHKNVTAILNAGLPGQESGSSLLPLLTGAISPSGKTVYTTLKDDSQYIAPYALPATDPHVYFSEELNIDYRRADALNLAVRYPFGFGLSYTTFAYSNLKMTLQPNMTAIARSDKYDTVASFSAIVSNTGSRVGSEVAQLYLSFPASANSPAKQLRGFTKVKHLGINARSTIDFDLRRRDISYWDVISQSWKVPSGSFTVRVGGSSADLPLVTTFNL